LESQKSSKLEKLTRMRITSVSIAVSPASFQIARMASRAEASTLGRSGGVRPKSFMAAAKGASGKPSGNSHI